MRKRVLMAALCIGLCLSQTACSLNAENIVDTISNVKDSIKNGDDVTRPQTPENLPVVVTEYVDLFPHEEARNFSSNFYYLKIEGEGYEELSRAVDAYFEEYRKRREARTVEFAMKAADNMAEHPDNYAYYSMRDYVEVRLCDNRILSFTIRSEEDASHWAGNQNVEYSDLKIEYEAVNFDAQTGEIIEFADLGNISDVLKANMTDIHSIKGDSELIADVDEVMASLVTKDECQVPFYIDGRGVNLVIDPDLVNKNEKERFEYPYIITASFEELPSFNSFYRPTTSEYKVALAKSLRNDILVDIDGDGKRELLEAIFDESEWYIEEIKLVIGDKKLNVPLNWAEGLSVYYWHTEDMNFIEIDEGGSNDWHTLNLIVLGEEMKNCGEIPGKLASIDKNGFTVETRIDLLGTWGVTRAYAFDADYNVTPVDDYYYMVAGYEPKADYADEMWTHLVVKEAFTDRNGTMIPVGTKLYPVYSDAESLIVFKDVDNNTYEIETTRPEDDYGWGRYVNGINEWDLFETLPYAG